MPRRGFWAVVLMSLFIKWVGASWDIAWHFRLENDAGSPAHLTSLAGNLLLAAALLLLWRRRTPAESLPLKVAIAGMALVGLAVPVDQLWHYLYGLDLTTWSPPHLLLFSGTGIACAGVAWLFLAQHGWTPGERVQDLGLRAGSWAILSILLSRAISPFLFPAAFNEHAAVGAKNVESGYTMYDVDAGIREFAAHVEDLPYDDLPHLLYPAYTVAIGLLLAIAIRRVTGVPWLATAAFATYLASRVVADAAIGAVGWPTSAIPFTYLLVALAVDAAWVLHIPAWARGGLAALAASTACTAYWGFAGSWIHTVPFDVRMVPAATAIAMLAGVGGAFWRPPRRARAVWPPSASPRAATETPMPGSPSYPDHVDVT